MTEVSSRNGNAEDGLASFFVYGTLKLGQCRERRWPCTPKSVEPAFVRGALFDLVEYPALTVGSSGWVAGELWQIPSSCLAETLRVLDDIEGFVAPKDRVNLYERIVVPWYREIKSESSGIAFTYVYCRIEDLSPARQILLNPASYWPVDASRS